MPRGLTPLEYLFDFNDVAKKPKRESIEADVEEYNIGSTRERKMIKLSETLPPCWGSHVLASLAIPKNETTSEPLSDLGI